MTTPRGLLPLEGGFNLRDMGGYPAADGRKVRHGVLYRSGIMSMLTDPDLAHLAKLQIATVCDFRRHGERVREPTRWYEPAGALHWSRDYEESSGVLDEVMSGAAVSAGQMEQAMIAAYREMPVDHAPSYRFMFERLLGGHVPLLFNCSAGKDRTGIAAALILSVLGVSRDDILEDYLLTNHADHRRLIARFGDWGARLLETDAKVIEPLMTARADYLEAMFTSLEQDHGGIDAYLAGLGVDAAAKIQLRDLLLV